MRIKHKFFLNSDGEGNLIINRADNPQSIDNYLSMQPNDADNRILRSEIIYDSTAIYNQYRCHAQQQVLNFSTSQVTNPNDFENDISGVLGVAFNRKVRQSRIYNFISSTSMNTDIAKKRATWESNFYNTKYVKYHCAVRGFTYDDVNLWRPNQNVEIIDFYAGINSVMLLCSLVFSLDVNEGPITRLCFVPPDSFTLLSERSESNKESQNLGKVYGSDQ
jgi:prophage tail gpP-like protein